MAASGSRQSTILVVDDDPVMRLLVGKALERAGYRVSVVDNGYAALNAIDDAIPDLVVSDVQMPGLSGFELVVRLRSSDRTSRIPVLFLSGAAMDRDDVVYGLSLGADDYILKPFEVDGLLAAVERRLASGGPASDMLRRPRAGLLSWHAFVAEVSKEALAAEAGGRPGVVGVIEIAERDRIIEQFGRQAMDELLGDLAGMASSAIGADGLVGRDGSDRLLILEPQLGGEVAVDRLQHLAEEIARRTFVSGVARVHVTPAVGVVAFDGDSVATNDLIRRASQAAVVAHDTLDLRPTIWVPALDDASGPSAPAKARGSRTWLQFAVTLLLGVVLPFAVYVAAEALGVPLANYAYVVVAIALLLTGVMIWTEGFFALNPIRMPETPSRPFPPASAIIAAYLPNEAATILDTLEAFLRIDYPVDLQVILAYNTPKPLQIEPVLRELAAREPRIEVLKVEGSTSKAQNVNAAVTHVRGEFVGVFDADHQPARDSFRRAWHWLCDEFDVVQGHCVVRNGDVSLVARTVAVEFEAIYAVSHPGRARLHAFGIFGGSNGYWRTELLRGTRMRGSMLTEDIDSSMRVVEAGGRIASDPKLYSRELAPTTVVGLWNQRMRWAQGWFQVSIRHLWRGWRSHNLRLRQKLGLTLLLGWREAYPWVSIQMIPIIAFFIYNAGGPQNLDWFLPVFVLTSLFTFGVGPGQTLFAWLLAAPEIKAHKRWFWEFLVVAMVLYTEFKNVINRVSQVKEFWGDREWKVTERTGP